MQCELCPGAEVGSTPIAAQIEAALPQMRHRGPDEGGIWTDADVVIGFRRLSMNFAA